jgi:hypothetical protein
MPHGLQMDPNLMGAPGEDLTKQESAIWFLGNDLEMSPGGTASFHDGHFVPVNRMTSNGRDEVPAEASKLPGTPGEIEFAHLPPRELSTQTQVRRIVFSDHQATAGFFVESMNNAGAKPAPDAA